jgi:type IV pilus assembly protein PilV
MPTTLASASERRGSGSRGFSLLEALIAVLIFSVGTLGVVGLQASMAKAQTASKYRADVAALSQQLIGTMWADQANLAKYADGQCSTHARCAEWKAKVASRLPAGASTTTVDSATGVVTIEITWALPNAGTHRYRTASAIRS